MISFLIKYIHLQMEMAEPVKFYSKTRSNILMNSIKNLFFPMKFLCKAINYFFKNYAAFFINISRHKNYIEFKRNFLFLLMKLYLIFIDQVVNCIVDNANGNILTNGKWRCYNDNNHRIHYRYNKL